MSSIALYYIFFEYVTYSTILFYSTVLYIHSFSPSLLLSISLYLTLFLSLSFTLSYFLLDYILYFIFLSSLSLFLSVPPLTPLYFSFPFYPCSINLNLFASFTYTFSLFHAVFFSLFHHLISFPQPM